jgi:cytochrome c oxidase subunit 2
VPAGTGHQPAATELARDLQWLDHTINILMFAVVALVTVLLIVVAVRFNRRANPTPARFTHNTPIEIAWTLIPVLILVFIGSFSLPALWKSQVMPTADITIKVTGQQWFWSYEYVGEDVAFDSFLLEKDQLEAAGYASSDYLLATDTAVVIPVGKTIVMQITGADVIHAWAVPAFGVKQDAIPGFVRDTWFRAETIGTYRGQCSELCGAQHAFMPIVVRVVSQEDYTKWVDEKKKEMGSASDDPTKVYTMDDQKDRGAKVYAANCAACHQPNGKGAGAFPALDGSKMVLGPKAAQYDILINGKGAMPKWAGVISDGDIAAVMTYTRNAWGNKTGDVIQTQDIVSARAGK